MTLRIEAPLVWLGPRELVRDAAVVAEGGTIAYAGPRAQAPPADEVVELAGFLMPGVADRHTHIRLADPGAVLLGGVTADLLTSSPLPLLLAH